MPTGGPMTSTSLVSRSGERVSNRRSQERARYCTTMTGMSQGPRGGSARPSGPRFGRTAMPTSSKTPRRTGNDYVMVDDPGRDAVRHRSLTLLRPSQEIKPLACRSAPNPNPDSHILPLRCPALGTTRIYRPCRRCFYLSGTGGSPNRRCCGHVTGRWLGRESPDRRLTATQDEYPARFSEWNKTHIL